MAKRRKTKATVDTQSAAYADMAVKWEKIDDLLGGTQAMREAGANWLPQMEKEKTADYERRLAQSFLFNAYADTVRKISAKPFTKPVALEEEDKLNDQLKPIKDNADGAGTNLTQLAKELFWIGINRGVVHMLVDFATTTGTETRDEEQKQGRRPVLLPIWPDQIIAWQTREGKGGETILSQIRIHEVITRYGEDSFEEEVVERIRVFTETDWQLWEKTSSDKKGYVKVSEGKLSRKGVPLVTAYFEKVDFMTADPPLEDLAWLNIEHWQSSSDQRNILQFARTGVWFLKGVSEEEADNLGLGPSSTFWTNAADADMKVVEHSGASIGAGDKDLRNLEERMQLMGLRPFVTQPQNATATGQNINEIRAETEIQAWIRAVEQMLLSGYAMAAEWVNAVLPEGFKVDIVTHFALSLRETQDMATLIEARKLKDIDQKTLLQEFKRRRILSDEVVVDEVVTATEDEGPDLSALGGEGFGRGGEGEGE